MITLLLSILCVTTAAAASDEPRLLQVQIIIRHADRAPIYEFTSPESAEIFPRGLGELSDEGLKHASEQGAAFRQHYIELGLMSEKTKASEIYIRSSPIKRVLMSATAFSSSLIGKSNGRVQLPTIYTTENEDDEKVLIVHDSIDYRCEVLDRHNISDRPLCRSVLLKDQIIKEFPDCVNFSYSRIEAGLAEIENSAVKLEEKIENCALSDARKIQFRSLSIRSGVGAEFDAIRSREVIGPLMSIVSKNVDDAVKGDTIEEMRMGAPVRIYCTHDHNILSVAQALGIISEYGERNPEFSSAIAIETWSSTEGFDIKIVMKDGVDNPFKSVAKFRFLDFKNRISAYTDENEFKIQWDEQVKKTYSFIQFGLDSGKRSSPIVPRVRTTADSGKALTYEILLVAAMVLAVVGVLVQRRNTYTRMY